MNDGSAARSAKLPLHIDLAGSGATAQSPISVRIATLSDLHIDYAENREALARLCAEIYERQADAILVVGDISHDDERIRKTLAILKELVSTVLYVPGNHELWKRGANAWDRYNRELAAISRAAGAQYLPQDPFIASGVAVVGSCGWYDYSFVDPKLGIPTNALEKKEFSGLAWGDETRVRFMEGESRMSDASVARVMERTLGAQIEEVEARADVAHVVVATHHLAFEPAVFRTGRLPWEFFNAFMGSRSLGEVIRKGRRVRAAVYGHTHVVGEFQIGNVRVFGTPLGYPRERKDVGPDQLAKTRVGWIDLD